MKLHRILAAALCVATLAACQQEQAPPADAAAAARAEARAARRAAREPATIPANCAVLAQRKWSAQSAGAEGAQTLTVEGEIDLPTPGYSVSLARADATNEGTAMLHLVLTPPTGVVAQAVTPTPVRYHAPAPADVRRVRIQCGDGPLRTMAIKPEGQADAP